MRPSGWVVVWGCYCSDAADDPEQLPTTCPCHGKPVLCPPVENTRPGPTTTGHRCNDHRTDEREETP